MASRQLTMLISDVRFHRCSASNQPFRSRPTPVGGSGLVPCLRMVRFNKRPNDPGIDLSRRSPPSAVVVSGRGKSAWRRRNTNGAIPRIPLRGTEPGTIRGRTMGADGFVPPWNAAGTRCRPSSPSSLHPHLYLNTGGWHAGRRPCGNAPAPAHIGTRSPPAVSATQYSSSGPSRWPRHPATLYVSAANAAIGQALRYGRPPLDPHGDGTSTLTVTSMSPANSSAPGQACHTPTTGRISIRSGDMAGFSAHCPLLEREPEGIDGTGTEPRRHPRQHVPGPRIEWRWPGGALLALPPPSA